MLGVGLLSIRVMAAATDTTPNTMSATMAPLGTGSESRYTALAVHAQNVLLGHLVTMDYAETNLRQHKTTMVQLQILRDQQITPGQPQGDQQTTPGQQQWEQQGGLNKDPKGSQSVI